MIGRRDLDEVGRLAVLEEQGDIAMQRRLIAFCREMVMGPLLDDIRRQGPLGQQRIDRDVLAGDVTTRQQRDRHADLVGALDFLAAGYGQAGDFFWA
jgi:hypothetical protein